MEVNQILKNARAKNAEQIKLDAQREIYKRSFYTFFKDACRKVIRPNELWQFNFHHSFICDLLQKEQVRMYGIRDKEGKIISIENKSQDIIINCPPSVSKSSIVSVCLTAWIWGFSNPSSIIINVSHSDDLALDFADQTKRLLESEFYQKYCPNITIRTDSSSKSHFKNTIGGERLAVSTMAGITGLHGNWIIVDDYVDTKNVSDVKLETAKQVFDKSISTRLADPNANTIVLIGQRVSDKDLYADLLQSNPESWNHVCLPMELSDDVRPLELREKYKNGVLWDERFPKSSFPRLSRSAEIFATQFQQSPKPLGGGIVKTAWFDFVETAPLIDYHVFVDTAYTDNVKRNDPTGILIAGLSDNKIYLQKFEEVWMEFPQLQKKLLSVVEELKNPMTKVYVEGKASGKSIVQQLRNDTMLNVVEIPSGNETKHVRLNSITGKLEARRVVLCGKGWDNFLYEITTFPGARHDEAVDCLTMAVNKLFTNSGKFRAYF